MRSRIKPLWVYLALAIFVVVLALGLAGILVVTVFADSDVVEDTIPEKDRVDCHPQGPITAEECQRIGCQPLVPQTTGPPACFFKATSHWYSYEGPVKSSIKQSSWSVVEKNKVTFPIQVRSNYSVTGEPAIKTLSVEFERYSTRVMGFRIKDAEKERYEVPRSAVKLAVPRRLNNHFYRVEYVSDPSVPFAFKIVRHSTNTTLFDTSLGGLVFEDNFLQIVTKLASSYVYGFGENRHTSFRHKMDWTTTPLFSRHAESIVRDQTRNYAGVHPFVMVVENDGNAHGIFMLNSNAMEYKLQPSPALTLRAMGGVMEFIICFGVTPNDVIIEYTQTIGRPEIPSYWSLGFHESALVNDADAVVAKFERAQLPLDVLHVRARDIDREWDVTVFRESLLKTVKKLHNAGGHVLVNLAAQIRVDAEDEEVRSGYHDGLWRDIFVKWSAPYDNKSQVPSETIGPSSTLFGYDKSNLLVAYVDFFQSTAVTWWHSWLTSLHQQIPWDGFSLDKNQPHSHMTNQLATESLQCPNRSVLDNPHYTPSSVRVWNSSHSMNLLSDDTICMIAEHKIGNLTYRHYDLHNIYGHAQADATKRSVWKITAKRGLVMSETSFPGTGTVAGTWIRTSLKESLSKAIKQSIISAFEFNLFGITLTGASAEIVPQDPAICIKWQIFSMFHVLAKSVLNDCIKDAGLDEATIAPVKTALHTRFRLLPYLYTQFFHGLMEGEAIFRPLFFEYGTKLHHRNVLDVDDQFFWGSAIMFAPSFSGGSLRSVYFPEDTFYRLDTGEKITGNASRQHVALPEDEMGIFLRAGYVVPTQSPTPTQAGAATIRSARMGDFSMLIVSHQHTDGSTAANGNLFWDDGESIDTVEKNDYMSWFIFNKWQNGNTTHAYFDYDVERNLAPEVMQSLKFSSFVIYGYGQYCSGGQLTAPTSLSAADLDTKQIHFDSSRKILTLNVTMPLSHSFKLSWSHPNDASCLTQHPQRIN